MIRWANIRVLFAAAALALAGSPAPAGPSREQEAAIPAVAVPAWRQASRVAIVTVHGEIDAVTRASTERRIAAAASNGAGAVVLELDTPGGDMYA
ncbi:MAG: hypothetical protein EBU31_08210, partial [Proteobacteria bacterium]|nr:hypothetical protein [Pseudomonadota bacterium]